MHCHLIFHSAAGMEVVFKVGEVTDIPPSPPGFPSCGNFKYHGLWTLAWTSLWPLNICENFNSLTSEHSRELQFLDLWTFARTSLWPLNIRVNFTLTSEHSRELQNPLSSEHSRELHSVLLLAQHPRTRKGFFPNLLWVFDLFDLILGVDRQIFFNIPIYWYWTLDHLWRVVCDNSKKIFRDYFFFMALPEDR